MEKLLRESGEKSMDIAFYKKLTRSFNCSSGSAGKPVLKWTEVQSWFQNRHLDIPSKDNSLNGSNKLNPDARPLDKANESTPTSKANFIVVTELRRDAAVVDRHGDKAPTMAFIWYDVDEFITCRNLSSGELEACVRFVGFGLDEDEWVNVKESVRERSLGLEP